MRMAHITFACFLLFCLSDFAGAQNPQPAEQQQNKLTDVEREVKEFYDSYAEDLRRHRPDAIANRYDPRGVYSMGQGRKSLESFAATRTRYLTKWKGPKSFEWKDMSIEVVSPDAAVVIARFEWQTDDGETFKYSYTGLVVRHSAGWRIRVEDESTQPKPATP
jgi:ketosteroid isomerase-like protein